MRTGIANFTLDTGRCPPWLFQRMVRLGKIVTTAIVEEFGAEEFLRRMSDPVWFQSLGTVLAFDWNASGLTTTTLGALKEALAGLERELDIFVCGGKKVSRRTPEEITNWGNILGFDNKMIGQLVYRSKIAAKVDSSLIQDGFSLYHHNFIFTKSGAWTVIQQGMNVGLSRARRYHWYGPDVKNFIEEPHAGIASQLFLPSALDLTAKESAQNRNTSLELVATPKTLYGDLQILAASSEASREGGQKQLFKILTLENREFHHHPVENINFASPHLSKILKNIVKDTPSTYQELLMIPGVGGKTIRALSLVAEVIYGAKPSYEDPARYSFAFGGKDGTPFPVDRAVYDRTLTIIENSIKKCRLEEREKYSALKRAEKVFGASPRNLDDR